MNPYTLTEDQDLLRRTVADVARKRVAPRAAEIDARAEYPQDMFERYLRDAKVLQIVEGTNQIQRNVVADAVLGRAR